MAESKASIEAGCKEVCQELVSREQAWLESFYDQKHMSIKEKETVELVQHAIDLPLQAQERVQKFFTKKGIAYVSTAWRELSAQLPKLDYEYIDWSPPLVNRTDSGARLRYDKETKTAHISLPFRPGKKTRTDAQRERTEDAKRQGYEEMSRRISDVKGRNKDRVSSWCKELEKRMVSVMEKHLSLK